MFVIGSILAGISQNVPELIAMRAIQGFGMGGLTANAQAILGSIISPRERGRYSGYMGATMAVATVSGPLLGGVIVDTPGLGRRWTFLVRVPLAVLSLFILKKYLRLATAIAIFIEARHPEPMVSLSMLRDRTTALAASPSASRCSADRCSSDSTSRSPVAIRPPRPDSCACP
ncbi:MAG: MFS transporter [Aeromicrobium sp.]